jgi:hypothetical protein
MSTDQTCENCLYAELECPPVIVCQQTGESRYSDSPACSQFVEIEL